MSRPHPIPDASYRLQLGRDCTFADAAELVPYLAELGVSHVYCSPYLKARHGSAHGYDITDHNAFHPQIGSEVTFRKFVDALRSHGMGHMLDLVSNHMGVGSDDNAWWLDVLESGPAAAHAHYFDIDWKPVLARLRGRVLLPVLGDHYGAVLERGDICLRFAPERGVLHIRYGPHYCPLDPVTYPDILGRAALRLGEGTARSALQDMSAAFRTLPLRDEYEPTLLARRQRDVPILRQRLAELCASQASVQEALEAEAAAVNGVPGDRASFDALHELLEAQAFRLAHWRVAADEINYRRFFDINDLASLRMEEEQVFADVHRLVSRLIVAGDLQGLRIDHVDGLYEPGDYARRLRRFFSGYLVVEKILASGEQLPEEWPVHGTTGYEFANLVGRLLVDPTGENPLTRLYYRIARMQPDFDEVLHASKRLVIRSQLSGELTMLANMADAIAQSDRHTRDFTLNGLRYALAEIAAWFPVYRTYVGREGASRQDRHYVGWAVARAVGRAPAEDAAVYRFLGELLLLEAASLDRDTALRERARRFVQRFQQYTGPVMAKALEDTALYRYNVLVSLNEVGGDPRRFSVSPPAFHRANRQRLERLPHCMLAGSTHDSKRSEDVRARLAVLSEMPDTWRRRVFRWRRLTRRFRRELNGSVVPSRNDEYLFYQTLLGVWPSFPPGRQELAELTERMVAYMLKAVREAKVDTSWINPKPDYEDGIEHFVRSVLRPARRNAFLADFRSFHQGVARFGALNGLSQTLLRLTAPGVPDIYQGNELWRFDLVDPDNRRPVDFVCRRRLLEELQRLWAAPDALQRIAMLAEDPCDDRVKLLLTWRTLNWRRRHAALYREGGYHPLEADGPAAEHVCAFARAREGEWAATLALRWPLRLLGDEQGPLPSSERWGDTWVDLTGQANGGFCRDVLTGARIPLYKREGRLVAAAAELFRILPVALVCKPRSGEGMPRF